MGRIFNSVAVALERGDHLCCAVGCLLLMSLEAAPSAARASPRRVARRDHLWCRPGPTAASLASTRLPHERNDAQRGAQRQRLVEPSSAVIRDEWSMNEVWRLRQGVSARRFSI